MNSKQILVVVGKTLLPYKGRFIQRVFFLNFDKCIVCLTSIQLIIIFSEIYCELCSEIGGQINRENFFLLSILNDTKISEET